MMSVVVVSDAAVVDTNTVPTQAGSFHQFGNFGFLRNANLSQHDARFRFHLPLAVVIAIEIGIA